MIDNRGHPMIRNITCIATILCSAIIISGCQGGPNLPLSTGRAPLQHVNRTVMLDRDVRHTLLYVNSVQKRLPGGQLLIQANFQSRMRIEDVWADIAFEFLDENNMLVDKTEWMTTLFPASQVTMVQGSSISPNAVKHVLLLKDLKTRDGRMIGPASWILEFP